MSGSFIRVSRRVGWGALFVAAAGLIVGTLSPLLADRFWVCEILCHFQPQYVIGLFAIAIAFMLVRRWRSGGLILAAALVAFLVYWLPIYWPTGRDISGQRSLRLLSTNLDFANVSPERFYALVDAEQPDVILVFELTREWAATLAMKERGYVDTRLGPSPGHSGCGIYSRLPLTAGVIRAIGPYPNFVVVAEVQVADQTLKLFGTHPLAPYSPKEMEARNGQLTALAELIGSEGKRTVVAGDFNTSSWSPCFATLESATRLRDSRQGFGLLPTFPSQFWPIRTTIDHCLVSDDLEVLDRRVGPDIGSDHLPILIDLRLSSATQ